MPRAGAPRVQSADHGRDRKRDRDFHQGPHAGIGCIGGHSRMTTDFAALRSTLDKTDMLGRIIAFPQQMEDAWKIGAAFAPRAESLREKHFSRVVVCGMGGSAI